MKSLDVNKKVRELLITNRYYVKHNRKREIRYEENYHLTVKDPDGKKRDLRKERNFKLSQLKYVRDYIKKIKPGSILDVGCGHGWLLSSLSKKWKKNGIEISKYAAKNASKFGEIFVGDVKDYKNKKFDIITALHIIEHHPKPIFFLKELKKRLAKNGVLILETPNFDSGAARKYKNNFRLLHDKTHISLFSEDSLIRLVRFLGFKVFDINYPFFETPFFTKKNFNEFFSSKKVSPPFYGSVITLFLKK